MFWVLSYTTLTPNQLNILVEDFGHACIADFGLAKVTQNLDSIRNVSCQNGHIVRWATPEDLSKGEYSKEAVIFSFTAVVIEVRYGCLSCAEL